MSTLFSAMSEAIYLHFAPTTSHSRPSAAVAAAAAAAAAV